jgi:Na+/H+ antiporter NhaD/arsenite permease-like protein
MVSFSIIPLWWALALGACLGGNGTLIGASANVIVGGMATQKGHELNFRTFIKVGFPVMLISVSLSTIYLIVFYL